MKNILNGFCGKALFVFVLALITAARGQAADGASGPPIKLNNAPITTAIEVLAKVSNITNYDIDPKLFDRFNEPTVTLDWDNYNPATALARLVKERNWILATNAFTTVVRITDTNYTACKIDVKLLGDDAKVPLFVNFTSMPLDKALKIFIKGVKVKVELDPQLTGDAPPSSPDAQSYEKPIVSVRWQNLTARQAIVELCDLYGLVIVKGTAPDSVLIKPKN